MFKKIIPSIFNYISFFLFSSQWRLIQLMAEKLRYAIFNCTEMDADFRLTDADVVGWGAAIAPAQNLLWSTSPEE